MVLLKVGSLHITIQPVFIVLDEKLIYRIREQTYTHKILNKNEGVGLGPETVTLRMTQARRRHSH